MEQNIKAVFERVKRAAQKSNRSLEDICVVAATKTRNPEQINALLQYGICVAGENRADELDQKFPLCDKQLKWHFIGQLQTNKVKKIIDKVELIHSLDRLSLCREIEKQGAAIAKVCDCLVQINLTSDSNRGGIIMSEAVDFVKTVAQSFEHIRIRGLMAVMPAPKEIIAAADQNLHPVCDQNLYLQMKGLYDILKKEKIKNTQISILSMGMSDDFEKAIEYGATMVRIGSAIFGLRSSNAQ